MTKTTPPPPPPPPPYHPYSLACWLHLLGMLYVFAEVHAAALAVSAHVCNVAALSFSTNAGRNNQHHRVRKRGCKKREKQQHALTRFSQGQRQEMERNKRRYEKKKKTGGKKIKKKLAKNSALTAGSHYTDTLPVACSVSSVGLQTFQGLVRVTSRSASSYVTVWLEPRHGLALCHGLARFASQSGSIYVTVWL